MIIATPTITHTGTRFLHREIFKTFKVKNVGDARDDENVIYHVHMFDKEKVKLNVFANNGWPVVIPLVHPARNFESICRRNKWPKEFFEQWNNMLEFCEQCSPMFLHLDDIELRELQSKDLIRAFDLPNDINWEPKTTVGATHGTHELVLTDAHIVKVPRRYIDFYEQMKEVS
jgi:hypothetical protein